MLKPILALAAIATLAGGAMFHAEIKSSIPAKGSTGPSPKMVSLTFTEAITPAVTAISIVKQDNSALTQVLAVKVLKGDTIAQAAVTKPLANGKYAIKWKTGAADDGHPTNGTIPFTVAN